MIEFIVVHCSATPPSMDIGVEEIREWHKQRRFRDVGYNYVGRRDGSVEIGRPEGDELAHARGFNRNSIAYCLVGGVNEHGSPQANFEIVQMDALRDFKNWMHRKYPDAAFVGHRDLPGVNKDCPCFDVAAWAARGVLLMPQKTIIANH